MRSNGHIIDNKSRSISRAIETSINSSRFPDDSSLQPSSVHAADSSDSTHVDMLLSMAWITRTRPIGPRWPRDARHEHLRRRAKRMTATKEPARAPVTVSSQSPVCRCKSRLRLVRRAEPATASGSRTLGNRRTPILRRLKAAARVSALPRDQDFARPATTTLDRLAAEVLRDNGYGHGPRLLWRLPHILLARGPRRITDRPGEDRIGVTLPPHLPRLRPLLPFSR